MSEVNTLYTQLFIAIGKLMGVNTTWVSRFEKESSFNRKERLQSYKKRMQTYAEQKSQRQGIIKSVIGFQSGDSRKTTNEILKLLKFFKLNIEEYKNNPNKVVEDSKNLTKALEQGPEQLKKIVGQDKQTEVNKLVVKKEKEDKISAFSIDHLKPLNIEDI
ncbi:hypothetical protein ACFLZV_07465, partial [Candidatus Margulisiibacteriota bacterium]